MSKTAIKKYLNNDYNKQYGTNLEAQDCRYHNMEDSSRSNCLVVKDLNMLHTQFHCIIVDPNHLQDKKTVYKFDNLHDGAGNPITIPLCHYVIHTLSVNHSILFASVTNKNPLCLFDGTFLVFQTIPKNSKYLADKIYLSADLMGKDLVIPTFELCFLATILCEEYSLFMDPLKLKTFLYNKTNNLSICDGLDDRVVETIWKINTQQPFHYFKLDHKSRDRDRDHHHHHHQEKKFKSKNLISEKRAIKCEAHKFQLFLNKEPQKYTKYIKNIFPNYFTSNIRINRSSGSGNNNNNNNNCQSPKGCVFKSHINFDDYVHQIFCHKSSMIEIFRIVLIKNMSQHIDAINKYIKMYEIHNDKCVKCTSSTNVIGSIVDQTPIISTSQTSRIST